MGTSIFITASQFWIDQHNLTQESLKNVAQQSEIYPKIEALVEHVLKNNLIGSIGDQRLGKSNLLNVLFNQSFIVHEMHEHSKDKTYFEKSEIKEGNPIFIDFLSFDEIDDEHDLEKIIFSLSFVLCDVILLHITN